MSLPMSVSSFLSKIAFALATLALPMTALAAPDAEGTKPAKPMLSEADAAALQHHHLVNVMEIEMGKLAQQRGTAAVKKYAATLVNDHQRADATARSIAKANGTKLMDRPAANSPEEADHKRHMDLMARLKTLKGEEFDREYLTAMDEQHTKEVTYLTNTIGSISDTKLRAHLEAVRPVVEKHAADARSLLAYKSGSSTPTPPSGNNPSPGTPTPPAKTPTPPKSETTPSRP